MIAAIIRKGEVIVPRGVTVFEEGDEVLAVTDLEGARQLVKLFCVQPIRNAKGNGATLIVV